MRDEKNHEWKDNGNDGGSEVFLLKLEEHILVVSWNISEDRKSISEDNTLIMNKNDLIKRTCHETENYKLGPRYRQEMSQHRQSNLAKSIQTRIKL